MKKILSYLIIVGIVIAIVALLNLPMMAKATPATHLVISEIKTSGGTGKTTDEFVELYNPTDQEVSLKSWQLIKKTASGSTYVLVDNFGDKVIKARSFFLVTHPVGYLSAVTPDLYYTTTNSIADNNSVILMNEKQETVDMVGWGTATVFEGEAAANSAGGKSLERKAAVDSTAETMIEGGGQYYLGNSEDTDNNKNDFLARETPEPQNSLSEVEYLTIVVPELPTPPVDAPAPPAAVNPAPPAAVPATGNLNYSQDIVITEIFPNPKGSDEHEFIELYNKGAAAVDLTGWKLGDNSSRLYVIAKDDLSPTIAGRGYLVIDKEISGISLNNTSDSAKLYFPDGTLTSSVEYASCPEGQSYNLIDGKWQWSDQLTPGQPNILKINNALPTALFDMETASGKVNQPISFDATDSSDADGDKLEFFWDFGDGQKAQGKEAKHAFKKAGEYSVNLLVRDAKGGESEAKEKISISDFDYSGKLLISELLPACQGPDADCEYLELHNPESRSINLDGWQLTDKKIKFRFPADAVIKAKGYLAVKRQESKIVLNNNADMIFLLDPAGKIINGVAYQKAKDDLSFSRTLDLQHWAWTKTSTPGQENDINLEEEEEIEEKEGNTAKGQEDKKAAEVSVEPVALALAQVDEGSLGKLIKVSGEVESTSGSNIYLTDETGGVLRAYIQKSSGIKKPEIKSGDKLEISGLLDKTAAGLRLLPRKQEDIVLLSAPKNTGEVLGASTESEPVAVPENHESKQVKTYLYFTAGLLIVGLAGWLVKLYIKKKQGSSIDSD